MGEERDRERTEERRRKRANMNFKRKVERTGGKEMGLVLIKVLLYILMNF